jgi:anti-sigma regulatory factor (Ser/Thr protein kinase)
MTPVTTRCQPYLELSLTVEHSEVSRARQAVVRALEDLGYESLIDDAVVIVSELATNAIRETEERLRHLTRKYIIASRVKVLLHKNEGHPVVEVWDPFPDHIPEVQVADFVMESGRGLFIVGHLAKDWGYVHRTDEQGRTWKSVWAVLK